MEDLFVKNSFADLNVILQDGKKVGQDVLKIITEYGYETIALNNEVVLTKKTQLKPPPTLESIVDSVPVSVSKKPLKILRRLTVVVEDPSLLHALSSPALESYDLLAIRPTNDKIFQLACGTLSIDVISVDLSERVPFTFKQAQIGLALERGVYFEICYSPAIRDITARRNTLANAVELVKVSKGKNIIVSSQAEKVCTNKIKAFDLRAPADVTNLCHLFGFPGPLCKSTITYNCRAVQLHAATRRRTAKAVVSSVSIGTPKYKGKAKTKVIIDKKQKLSKEPTTESRAKCEPHTLKRKRSSEVDTLDKDLSLPPAKLKDDSTFSFDTV